MFEKDRGLSKIMEKVIIGDCTLIHGDCLEAMKEPLAYDHVITDAPYGISVVRKGGVIGGNRRIGNTPTQVGVYEYVVGDENTDTMKNTWQYIKDCKSVFLFGGNYFNEFLPPTEYWLIWDKYASGNYADGEMIWTNVKTQLRIYRYVWNGFRKCDRTEKRVHPTQKPVVLMQNLILDFTNEGDAVLDCFMGSGATAVACAKTGRKFIGIEISKKYFDTTCKRVSLEYENKQHELELV